MEFVRRVLQGFKDISMVGLLVVPWVVARNISLNCGSR